MSHLQDILRKHLRELQPLPLYKRVALKHIMTCKTSECGLIKRECNHCEAPSFQYKSCGSRYCNQCGHLKKSIWVDDRLHESLDVHYFFITFTIPNRLHQIFLFNEKLCYQLLFKASADALKAAMKGAYENELEVGFMSVLHTHNQELGYHPHIHVLMPGGGISEDQMEWVHSKKNFLVAEKILKQLFRVKLSQYLKQAFKNQQLKVPPKQSFQDHDTFFRYIYGKEKVWNLQIEACNRHPEHVIHYLGRYVNKTAISDERIVDYNDHHVTIKTKNRATHKAEHVTIHRLTFISRFLMHILPKGMGRIRYFGFLSNRFKSQKLSLLEKLLKPKGQHLSRQTLNDSLKLILLRRLIKQGPPCQACAKGHMVLTEVQAGQPAEVSQHLFGFRTGIP